MESTAYQFGDFELDCYRYELRRNGRAVKLERIPMELLILLVENDGAVVTRRDIVQRLWGNDVFLDTEHGINTAVRKIRAALKDDAEKPRFVQTVTGKGYRFVAAATHGREQRNTPPPATASSIAQTRRWALIPIAVVIVLAAGGWIIADQVLRRSEAPHIRSIAILPLANLSGDPAQDYFADGITDELTTMLAKNTSLQVLSRTSAMQFKNARRPLKEIAKALGTDAILEGSLQRSGTRLHMTVQLIYAPSDMHLWANSYDRDADQAWNLPAEVAQAVGKRLDAINATVTPARYVKPEAHDAYLRGRYFWFAGEFDRAREYMEKSVQLQPDYAAAWSGLADAYGVLAIAGRVPPSQVRSQAEDAARRGVELDERSAEAHNTVGAINLFFDWNWQVADEQSEQALALDPNSAIHHHLRAYVLTAMHRLDEAVQEERRGAELAPFQHPFAVGLALLNARQYDAAIEELRLRKEAQSSDAAVRFDLAKCYRLKGMGRESAAELAALFEVRGDRRAATEVQEAYRRGGAHAVAQWQLDRLRAEAKKHYVSPFSFATAYAVLGRKEQTLKALQGAYEDRAPRLVFLQADPDFDFVHSEERYRAIVRKMGLPAAY